MNAARETAVTEDLPRFAVDIPEDMPADSLAPAACFPEGGIRTIGWKSVLVTGSIWRRRLQRIPVQG